MTGLPAGSVVLFADDDPDDRFLMVQACKAAGIADRLAIVEDGQQVMDYLSASGEFAGKDCPNAGLVILDINMPRMSGFEALQWIRKSAECDSLPVIILSASGQPKDIKTAYQLGACAYIMKPSTPQELFELVGAIKKFWLQFVEIPALSYR